MISSAAAQRTSPVVADHRATHLSAIPAEWINRAKTDLVIAYGHTSHGSQLVDGMTGLVDFAGSLYAWNGDGSDGALQLRDGPFPGAYDLGNPDRTTWSAATRTYLNAHPEVNVVIWSWCGQVDGTEAEIASYLSQMNALEAQYPNVKFVYMTGHLNGGGAEGNVNQRNNQIREYVAAHNKILYDFADIESYDPDGLVHYMPLYADDGCNYTGGNWCTAWQGSHVEGVDWYDCGAAHSYPINANRKAYAAWWLWARLAGWTGGARTQSINDASAVEGSASTTNASFTVTMSQASTSSVTVRYATSPGTATADSDYLSTSGTLTFAPGETSKTIDVAVVGDTIDEPNETFYVTLSEPVGADISDGEGLGTIVDDDVPTVSMSLGDVSVAEGNPGSAGTAVLPVTLSGPATQTVTVDFATANGTATAGIDYASTAGSLSIPAGATSGSIAIPLIGDRADEPDETFVVNLSNAYGALVSDGQGQVTITNDDALPAGVEHVVWTSLVGVTASGSSLTKTAATAWGNAGAVSTQRIVSGDGYVEFTAYETTSYRMLGLSNGNSSASWDDIDFSLYLYGGQIQVYEAGSLKGTFGSYATGDALRVAVTGSVVSYSRNGVVFYTSTRTPVYPLLVDCALYTQSATLSAVVIQTSTTPPPSGVEAVAWTSLNGVTASGNSLTKTATTAWGNGGAISTQTIASGDGYVEFTASETTSYRMLGLSNGNTNASWEDIDFSLYLYGGQIQVYEAGTLRGTFGTYATGDKLRVAVSGGVVRYSRNGSVFYTSTRTPLYPLLVDCALYSQNATLSLVMIARGTIAPTTYELSVTRAGTGGGTVTSTPLGIDCGGKCTADFDQGTAVELTAGASAGSLFRGWSGGGCSGTGTCVVTMDAAKSVTATFDQPALFVDDLSLAEGDSGSSNAVVTVRLSPAAGSVVTVHYATADGTATTSDSDYAATSGDLTFPSGTTSLTISIPVTGDTTVEPNETFVVNLSSAVGALIADAQGQVTITNDDGAPAKVTPAVWTSLVGVRASGNSLTKTAATAWGNAGAVSRQVIASGDAYVEFTASETTSYRMLGLSNGNTNSSWDDIDFSLYLFGSQIQVYEAGTLRGSFGTYASGDVLRVAVTGGVVAYSRNGTVFYTSARTPVYPLLVDTSLYTQNATLNSVVLSGVNVVDAVIWTGQVGVATSGNGLRKTAATAWGNAGAISTQAIAAGDGYVAFRASETTTYRMLGLSNGNTNSSWDDIDFSLYLYGSQIQVYEAGTLRGSFGTYASGDVLGVAVTGGVVTYSRNGTVFYTSTGTPSYPLLVDTALYSQNATLNSVVIAGAQ